MPPGPLNIPDCMGRFLLAPVLGHGRMAETYLAAVALVFGVILCFPDAVDTSQATRDPFFQWIGSWLAVPFFLKAYTSGYGVVGTIRGWSYSHTHRFIGAILGVALWGWYAAKFVIIGAVGSVGFPFASVAVFVCLRVMMLSLLRIPPAPILPPREA